MYAASSLSLVSRLRANKGSWAATLFIGSLHVHRQSEYTRHWWLQHACRFDMVDADPLLERAYNHRNG